MGTSTLERPQVVEQVAVEAVKPTIAEVAKTEKPVEVSSEGRVAESRAWNAKAQVD